MLLRPAPAEHEVIDEHHSIPQGDAVEATHGERPLLMGREPPHRWPGQANFDREKERLTVGYGEVHQRIRLPPAVFEVQQGQEGIQE